MESLGSYLRQMREEKDLTLEEVSTKTRISVQYLLWLENDQFEKFPSPVYARSFLKTYARYLKVDPEVILEEFDSKHLPSLSKSIPSSSQYSFRKRKRETAIGAIALMAIIFVTWYSLRERRESTAPQVISSPSSLGKVASSSLSPPPSVTSESRVAPPSLALSPKQKPREKKASIESLNLVAIARENTWVKVVADGKKIFEGIVKKGKRVEWKAKDKFTLRIGRADGLDLYFKGKKLPPMSSPGGIIRKLELTEKGIWLDNKKVSGVK